MSESKMKITYVGDYTIANLMAMEGYTYLYHEDGAPVRFIDDDAADKALYWQDLINAKIPLVLTLKEICVLSKLVADNPSICKQFGVEDVGNKIDKAVFDRTR